MLIQTRAMLRDDVRRVFSQVPPIDTSSGVAGAQPTRNPWPTNPSVNMFLDHAVAYMSRIGRLSGDALPRMLPIPAQEDALPFVINLQSLSPSLHTNEVRRVAWYDSTGTNESKLKGTSRQAIDWQQKTSSMYVQPGTPMQFWVESMSLYIWPAPVDDGTLSLMCGTSMWSESQNLDGEVPELIPVDYYPLLINKTASLLCATQPEDQVLAQLNANLMRDMIAQQADWLSFCATQNKGYQGFFTPKRTRSGMMMGRR